jgi:DNA-binding MarR family transcriptional regulator
MSESLLPALPCMCASLRRTSRALTQLYEQALRPHGLRASQFTILQALALAGDVTQGLTRTLAIMGRQGWITARPGKDRRERRLQLASGGQTKLRHAQPQWGKVQSRLRRQLGAKAWKNLQQLTQQVTQVVKTQGGSL